MSSSTPNYNIRWIEKTFRSRQVAEALLSPERESGNITTNDYELAIRFLPGFHRYYSVLGGIVAIPIVYSLRRRGWNAANTYVALFAGSTTGFIGGKTIAVVKHYNFVHSLENPDGFCRALENLRRGGGTLRQNHADQQSDLESKVPFAPARISSEPASIEPLDSTTAQPDHTTRTPKPASRWEQIRTMNARSTPMSSWEEIRQKHGKAHITGSGVLVAADGEVRSGASPGTEQAEFDAMLDRERKMSENGDYPEYK